MKSQIPVTVVRSRTKSHLRAFPKTYREKETWLVLVADEFRKGGSAISDQKGQWWGLVWRLSSCDTRETGWLLRQINQSSRQEEPGPGASSQCCQDA
jgi:hypothetical protein